MKTALDESASAALASAALEAVYALSPDQDLLQLDSSTTLSAADLRVDKRKKDLTFEIWITRAAIALTMIGSIMLALDVGGILRDRISLGWNSGVIEHTIFLLVIYYFVYGNMIYLFTRSGHLSRARVHQPAERSELESIYDRVDPPSLTILVPSYKEERSVVVQTLLSAGLMEYPSKRIVLLIDDPPNPSDEESIQLLKDVRELPRILQAKLDTPRQCFAFELSSFLRRSRTGYLSSHAERQRLAVLYRKASEWFQITASGFEIRNHTDRMFIERILREPSYECLKRAQCLVEDRRHQRESYEFLLREYRRLAALFSAEFTSFERKQFANLSHTPNKAMNLNSYISLTGKSLRIVHRNDGLHAIPCQPGDADFSVPKCDYLITLDADSLLLNDYAIRLIHFMQQTENSRVAVAQTPYSAVPGTPILIERIAGATTDIQHLIHQGFTSANATYWVGANALLRRSALDDIAETVNERGHQILKYIRDRTVIEDTESSVDLVSRGWSLYNYPDRLAYSATPPDFGTLVIQRRRWANGGLLILPKLLQYLSRSSQPFKQAPEAFMRVHYLTSLTGMSFGMLVLLGYPFENNMRSWWLLLTALPYYFLYGRDLVRSGYQWIDLPRVSALNLLLIPVHLGGILKSLHQAFTGCTTPFVRTPKVSGRTAAPRLYIIGTLALLALCFMSGVIDVRGRYWIHCGFALLNGGLILYALLRFVGIRAASEDLGLKFRSVGKDPKFTQVDACEAD